jgi:hypothetical protein
LNSIFNEILFLSTDFEYVGMAQLARNRERKNNRRSFDSAPLRMTTLRWFDLLETLAVI